MTYIFICQKGDQVAEADIQPQGMIKEAIEQADPFKGMDQDKSVLPTVPLFHMHDGESCPVTVKPEVR